MQAPRYSHRDITRVPTPITDAQNRAWKGVCLTQGLSGWSLHGQTLHTPGVCHSPHVADAHLPARLLGVHCEQAEGLLYY